MSGIRLFNSGWEFSKNGEPFYPVGLPHDWAISDVNSFYEDAFGQYKKRFDWEIKADERVFLRFDGVYMDSRFYLNGQQVWEWKYGYSTFEFEITQALLDGENELLVTVDFRNPNSRWYSGAGIYRNVWLRTVHEQYLAADGVYFHAQKEAAGDRWKVELRAEVAAGAVETPPRQSSAYIPPEGRGCHPARAERPGHAENAARLAGAVETLFELWDPFSGNASRIVLSGNGRVVTGADGDAAPGNPAPEKMQIHCFSGYVDDPVLWDVVEQPYLYLLRVKLVRDGEVIQEEEQEVGFRTVEFLTDEGFCLNGRKLKLNGVCDHHDLGCLGSAFHPQAMERKLRVLKEMGCNAIRCSHNMSAPEVLKLADRMGFLVVAEAFDMWESGKTPYDYARFFTEWYPKDVASWVRRDRNHPCVIMWSIGNEIHDTHTGKRGQMWTRVLMEETQKHDPLGNARVTIGSNYMPWENAQKCADLVKLEGYNYGANYYERHHREHPDWILYGSETGSIVQSRGIYHFPYDKSVLADEDQQCSSLGNSTTSWGANSHEECVRAEWEHPYSCGQFLWSGFDYIGEPTPYHTKNSYFGQIDTAGFPKDAFYCYQAAWRDPKEHPMVHLFPYWDYNEGQEIDVRVYSNAASVELFLNGESQGVRQLTDPPALLSPEEKVRRKGAGVRLSATWKVRYTPGEIRAAAYDEKGRIIAEDVHRSFGEPDRIVLRPYRSASSQGLDDIRPEGQECALTANGTDLLFIEISMEDREGNPVENALNRVNISVTGAGALVGTDNGDSTDRESYKSGCRRLFSGKLLAVVKADDRPGTLTVTVASHGLKDAVLSVPVTEGTPVPGSSPLAYLPEQVLRQGGHDKNASRLSDTPVRAIRLKSLGGTILTAEHPETLVAAVICPPDATDRELSFSVVDDSGIPSSLAVAEPVDYLPPEMQPGADQAGNAARLSDTEAFSGFDRLVRVRAVSDGKVRLRCTSRSGTKDVRMISQIEFTAEGLGKAFLDPYGFIAGALYDYSRGTPGSGNEHGVATARDGETQVGYHNIDFGTDGSDEITIPIFALTDNPYEIEIYEGMPGEPHAEKIAEVVYQKKSIWNTYQPETYHLNRRLRGVTSLCFVLRDKIHIKGFSFTRQTLAYERLTALDCRSVYGDQFERDGEWVKNIGNNVTLEFGELDFGETGAVRITIAGRTPLPKNSILLKLEDIDTENAARLTEEEETPPRQSSAAGRLGHAENASRLTEADRRVLEFPGEADKYTFALEPLTGKKQISLVFLPGCSFDFHWLRFDAV
ncbi:MAG: DUF4982 domain-containing protein [Lachnospiraceae bacterium]|nr:DUF4982 domain-containing protein [Lachnospiraceae bacterium]